jgi:hypothetical protein
VKLQRNRFAAIRRPSAMSWRQAFAVLALALFAFQNYVTQTHVHLLWHGKPNAFVQSLGLTHAQVTPPGKQKPANDPANCPLCQDIALAGHFTTPGAVAFLLPALVVAAAAAIPELPAHILAPTHDWQGRAPPRR